MTKTTDKTWWLQTRENPERLEKVKLIKKDGNWVLLEAVNAAGRPFAAYALEIRTFDIQWRTWKIMPTRRMMESEWTGRTPKKGRVQYAT